MLVGMTPRAKIETRSVDIKGRDIQVKRPADAQLALLSREARLLDRENVDSSRKMQAVGRMFDIFESWVVSDDDREYLVDLVVQGDLELGDLIGIISVFRPDEEEQSKPTVRRGRRAT